MPTAIQSIKIWEDKTLISGSLCGKINIYEIDSEKEAGKCVYKC